MTSNKSTVLTAPASADGSFEGRWDAWRARGLAHDRRTRRLLSELLPALVFVGVSIYILILIW